MCFMYISHGACGVRIIRVFMCVLLYGITEPYVLISITSCYYNTFRVRFDRGGS